MRWEHQGLGTGKRFLPLQITRRGKEAHSGAAGVLSFSFPPLPLVEGGIALAFCIL